MDKLSGRFKMYLSLLLVLLIVVLLAFYCFSIFRVKQETERSRIIESEFDLPYEGKQKLMLCNGYTKECPFPNCRYPCCVTALLETYRYLRKLFNKAGIPLWIVYGTLLGHQRHQKGLIPYDDDFDTMTLGHYADKIEAMRPLLEKRGHILERRKTDKNGDYPAYDYYCLVISATNKNHIDIALAFETEFEGETYIQDAPSTFKVTDKHKQWLIKKKDLFPLKEGLIYDLPISIPKEPVNVLKFWYGDSVLTKALVKPSQMPGILDHLVPKELTDFYPAKRTLHKTSHSVPNRELGINKCYIINDVQRWDRLHYVMEQLEQLKLPAEAIKAVMGRNLNLEQLTKEGKLKANPKYTMRPNEVGCFLSHIKAWTKIAQAPQGRYLVLEDDCRFSTEFEFVMKEAWRYLNAHDWDMCSLNNDLYIPAQEEEVGKYVYETGECTSMCAYILTPRSARKLLARIYPMTYPVDLVATTFNPVEFPPFNDKYDTTFHKDFKRVVVSNHKAGSGHLGVVEQISVQFNDSSTAR